MIKNCSTAWTRVVRNLRTERESPIQFRTADDAGPFGEPWGRPKTKSGRLVRDMAMML